MGSLGGRSSGKCGRYPTETLTRPEDWRALEPEWRRLSAAGAPDNAFLTWEWLSAWCAAFGSERRQPAFIVAGRHGEITGMLAAVVDRVGVGRYTLGHLALAGSGRAGADHLDAVLDPGDAAPAAGAIADALLSPEPSGPGRPGASLVRLDGLAAGSALAAAVDHRAGARPVRRLGTRCPYLPLPGSWDELLARLSRNRRDVLRRKERSLERDHPGAATYRRVDTVAGLAATFPVLVDLHQAVRRARGDRGAFADPRLARFHADVAGRFLRAGMLRLYVLEVDGKVVAAINCWRRGDRVAFLHTGYDEALARHSPGMLVLAHAIRASIAEGATEFDFLRGDEPYKHHWTGQARDDVRLWVALRPAGAAFLHGHSAARGVRNRFSTDRGRVVLTAWRRAAARSGPAGR